MTIFDTVLNVLTEAEMPGVDQATQEEIIFHLNKVAAKRAPELDRHAKTYAPIMLVNLENPFGDPIPTMFFLRLERAHGAVMPYVRGGFAFWKGLGADIDKHIPSAARHRDAQAYVQLTVFADSYTSEEDFEIANEDRYEEVMRMIDHESAHIQRGHDPRMDWEKAEVGYDPGAMTPASMRKLSKFRSYAGHPIETDADIAAVLQYVKRLGQEEVSKKYLDNTLNALGVSHLLGHRDVRRRLLSRLAKAGFRFKRTWAMPVLPSMPGTEPRKRRPV